MGTNKVENNFLNATIAGKITKKLSEKRKNQTDAIKADVWNEFVQQIGTGNKIKNQISLQNAVNSITKYAVVEAHKQNKKADEVAKEWFNLMGLELSAKKADEVQTAVMSEVLQSNETGNKPAVEIDQDCEHATYREDGTLESVDEYSDNNTLLKTTHYLTDGKTIEYEEEFSPTTGKVVKSTDYTPEGKVKFVNENDDDGIWIRQTNYRENGTVDYINEYDPAKQGEIVFTTHYKADGKTVDYID